MMSARMRIAATRLGSAHYRAKSMMGLALLNLHAPISINLKSRPIQSTSCHFLMSKYTQYVVRDLGVIGK